MGGGEGGAFNQPPVLLLFPKRSASSFCDGTGEWRKPRPPTDTALAGAAVVMATARFPSH